MSRGKTPLKVASHWRRLALCPCISQYANNWSAKENNLRCSHREKAWVFCTMSVQSGHVISGLVSALLSLRPASLSDLAGGGPGPPWPPKDLDHLRGCQQRHFDPGSAEPSLGPGFAGNRSPPPFPRSWIHHSSPLGLAPVLLYVSTILCFQSRNATQALAAQNNQKRHRQDRTVLLLRTGSKKPGSAHE